MYGCMYTCLCALWLVQLQSACMPPWRLVERTVMFSCTYSQPPVGLRARSATSQPMRLEGSRPRHTRSATPRGATWTILAVQCVGDIHAKDTTTLFVLNCVFVLMHFSC